MRWRGPSPGAVLRLRPRVGQGQQRIGRDQVGVALHEAVGRVDPAPVGLLALGQGGDRARPASRATSPAASVSVGVPSTAIVLAKVW